VAIHFHYFEDRDGNIQLPPDDETYFTQCPPGYDRREANTLDEVDKVQKRLQEADYKRHQAEYERDDAAWAGGRQRITDSLNTTIASSTSTQYGKDFARAYLQLREDKKKAYHKKMFEYVSFLEMRENDKPRNVEELLGESL